MQWQHNVLLINKSKGQVGDRRQGNKGMQTKFCLVLTGFHQIKRPFCEELSDSQRSAHERSLSGTRVSVSVITDVITRPMNAPSLVGL